MENNNYQVILNNLENQIKNGQFNSKEELNKYITYLKSNLIPQETLNNEKVLEFLNLYDSIHQNTIPELDMQNYKGVSLENQNVIVNQKDDVILKTYNSNNELSKEFKEVQNEITANNQDGLANADMVFDYMRDNLKEELYLISLNEAIKRENIDIEMLNKIKFFVSNQYVDPNLFKVDLNNGFFYNVEDNSVFEVRKNEQTGKYEIYKGGEIIYGGVESSYEYSDEKIADNQVIMEETNDEQLAYKNKNVKVRKLVRPNDLNNAAFAKSGLLFIIILFVTIILTVTLIS